MKVWITKYALTEGIMERDVESDPQFPSMVTLPGNGGSFRQSFHGEGKDWHRSRDAAVIRAENMRHDKIRSIKKQIARLERLTFGVSP